MRRTADGRGTLSGGGLRLQEQDLTLKTSNSRRREHAMMNYLSSLDLKDRDTQIYAGAAIGAVTAGFLVRRSIRKRRENAPIPAGAFPASDLPKDCYDAIIVGAGTWSWRDIFGSFLSNRERQKSLARSPPFASSGVRSVWIRLWVLFGQGRGQGRATGQGGVSKGEGAWRPPDTVLLAPHVLAQSSYLTDGCLNVDCFLTGLR